MGFAAGLAREGFFPYVHTFAVFICRRPFDQVAMSIGYSTLLCWATWTVSTRTAGEPPLLLNAFAVIAAILATILLELAARSRR